MVAVWRRFPIGLAAFACVALGLYFALFGLVHRGVTRAMAVASAVALVAGSAGLLLARDGILTLAVLVGLLLTLTTASAAFRARVELRARPRPRQPVLFYNPRSGRGKAERLQSRPRRGRAGSSPSSWRRARTLRSSSVRRCLAVPMRSPWPAAAGRRRWWRQSPPSMRCHMRACPRARATISRSDLGVDRDDVVGALDALVDGGERVVDLAEVNGRVFVNNVSLGVYGEAGSSGYREAKLRTLLDTIPDVVESRSEAPAAVLDRPGWPAARGSRNGAGIQQPLPPGQASGLGNPPQLGRGSARHRRGRCPDRRSFHRVMRSRPWRDRRQGRSRCRRPNVSP